MVRESEKRLQVPDEGELVGATNSRTRAAAEMQIDAHRIASAMREAGRVKDERNRRQLAENLGKILAKRKDRLNLSEFVVKARVSENPDPSRLSRFRILPGKELTKAGIRRLSQDPLAYVRLAEAAAQMTDENPAALVQELVVGTKFELAGLEGVPIEPFEQMLSLIESKISAIDSKYDLQSYFKKVQEKGVLPVWSVGPSFQGQIASHVLPKRPEPLGWRWPDRDNYAAPWDILCAEVMPSVPLFRLPQKESFKAKVRIGSFKDDDATMFKNERIFLSIGMFEGQIVNPKSGSLELRSDKGPTPYLIGVTELWYGPEFGLMLDLERITGEDELMPRYWVAGNVWGYVEPADPSFSFELIDVENPGNMGLPWLDIESHNRLSLTVLRNVFGREGYLCSDGDALDRFQKIGMTLAPHDTILANMESQLIYGRRRTDEPGNDAAFNFLDLLEADAERLTSSFSGWYSEEKKKLEKRHQELLEQYIHKAAETSGEREKEA